MLASRWTTTETLTPFVAGPPARAWCLREGFSDDNGEEDRDGEEKEKAATETETSTGTATITALCSFLLDDLRFLSLT